MAERSAFVTGGSGFIGGRLIRRLVGDGFGVRALARSDRSAAAADEATPLRPDSPALYPSTKARAEQAVRDANGDGFETVVVRPRFVWGVGDTSVTPAIAEAVRRGRFSWIGGGRHRTSTTHVDNTVEGLVLGAMRARRGNAYFVTDGEPVVFREFVSQLLQTQGIAAPTRSIPHPLPRALAGPGGAG